MVRYEVAINNKTYAAEVVKYSSEEAEININGTPYLVKLDKPIHVSGQAQPDSSGFTRSEKTIRPIPLSNQGTAVSKTASIAAETAPDDGEHYVITAPIPGSIIKLMVSVGDEIKAGQVVCKMEAMKMENDINAKEDGIVQSISVSPGEAVNQGMELMIIGSL